MQNWPTKKLGEVCGLDRGTNPIRSSLFSKTKKLGHIRFIQLRDFETDEYIVFIPDNLKITVSNEKDGIIALSGATAGKVVKGLNGAINSALLRVRPLDGHILNKSFLYYFLLFSQKLLRNLGRGAAQPNISKVDVAKIKIPIPSPPIQQKIVERLDAIKKAQELNDKQVELVEELFQSLLNKELKPQKKWKKIKLSEVGEIITGTTPSTKKKEYWGGQFLWATPTDIDDDIILLNDTQKKLSQLGFKNTRPVPENSVLVTCIASIGKMCVAGAEMATNQQINSIICNDFANPFFVFYVLKFMKSYIIQFAKTTAVPIINKSQFGHIKIPLPSINAQRKIVKKLSAIQDYKKKLLEQKQKLQELFESVLSKSMRGELV